MKRISGITKGPFSTGIVSGLDYDVIKDINPDIIHLHWICGGCVAVDDLKMLSKKYPVVWTLHDSWAFTGGCHIPHECKKYETECHTCLKVPRKFLFDISKYIFHKKRKYYTSDIKIISPSRWMAECAKKSMLLRGNDIRVIPNGLDLQQYQVRDKLFARQLFNLKTNKKIILFGAMSVSDENKGFKYLCRAIQLLYKHSADKECIEVVVFGAGRLEESVDFGFRPRYIGALHDEVALNLLYSAADVMVVPSKSESFGQTVMESMASGTPCVAFNCTGVKDIIDHMTNGYLARPYEPEDIAAGIEYVINHRERWTVLSQKAREKVLRSFEIGIVAQKYKALYEEVLEGK